jgi:hypothetical protein
LARLSKLEEIVEVTGAQRRLGIGNGFALEPDEEELGWRGAAAVMGATLRPNR